MTSDHEAHPQLVEEFLARATAAGCTIRRVSTAAGVADLLSAASPTPLVSAGAAALTELPETPLPSTPEALVAGGAEAVAVAVVAAEAAVAETGSLLVTHDDVAELWLVGLSEHLILVVREEAIVDSLATAAPVLERISADGRSWTMLTGPSRTADIERVLTIGVQGSFDMTVAVLS
jgi:L-lactate dehydrogenase complex protein LldG